jgi:Ca2+-binding RTX toxin-like protein
VGGDGAVATAGNATIDPGNDGQNAHVAGAALTLSGGAVARAIHKADVQDDERGRAEAGNDSITATSEGTHWIAGDAAAFGNGNGQLFMALAENLAAGPNSHAGNDYILVDGNPSFTAGDALTTGEYAHAHVVNSAVGTSGHGNYFAGNDTIYGDGTSKHVIAGDALALGKGSDAKVNNTAANASAIAVLGSDYIDLLSSGSYGDLISGDALANNGGTASAQNNIGLGFDGTLVGSDTVYAGAGNDTIAGDALANGAGGVASAVGAGNDFLYGGDGNDTISGDAYAMGGASATITGGGNDYIDGGSGSDLIYGDANYNTGSEGGDDIIHGGSGNDTIYGNGGDDIIFGEGNNDTIFGGDGDDWIDGGAGNDSMTGGNGADTFHFVYGGDGSNEVDRITDFDMAEGDILDLSDLLDNLPAVISGANLLNHLDLEFVGGNTIVHYEVDGLVAGSVNDGQIILDGVDLTSLGANDAARIQALLDSGNLVVD